MVKKARKSNKKAPDMAVRNCPECPENGGSMNANAWLERIEKLAEEIAVSKEHTTIKDSQANIVDAIFDLADAVREIADVLQDWKK